LCKSRLATSTLPGFRREDELEIFVFVQGKVMASATGIMQGQFRVTLEWLTMIGMTLPVLPKMLNNGIHIEV
jgi:hypothetical protein